MVLFQKFSTRSSIEETSHNQQPATHCPNSSDRFTAYHFQQSVYNGPEHLPADSCTSPGPPNVNEWSRFCFQLLDHF